MSLTCTTLLRDWTFSHDRRRTLQEVEARSATGRGRADLYLCGFLRALGCRFIWSRVVGAPDCLLVLAQRPGSSVMIIDYADWLGMVISLTLLGVGVLASIVYVVVAIAFVFGRPKRPGPHR